MATKYILYHYDPSFAAAMVGAALFGNATIAHMWLAKKWRTWYFIPFIIGGIFEMVGYTGRVISSKQTPNWTTPPYIMQSLLPLLGPALFAASIYMVLGRIIRLTDGESHSSIKSKWLTKIFVTGDVLGFLAQSAGGGMIATAKSDSGIQTGENVITGGLFLQLLFFCTFIIVSASFHYRMVRSPTERVQQLEYPWERNIYILYVASFLIIYRSIIRIIEYIQGTSGDLLQHEYWLYIGDTVPMFLVMVIFIIWYPGRVTSKSSLKASSTDSSRDVEGHPMSIERK